MVWAVWFFSSIHSSKRDPSIPGVHWNLRMTGPGGPIRARVGLSWVAGVEAVAEREAVAGQGRTEGEAEPGQAVKTEGVVGQRLRAGARVACGIWSCR